MAASHTALGESKSFVLGQYSLMDHVGICGGQNGIRTVSASVFPSVYFSQRSTPFIHVSPMLHNLNN